MIDVDTIKSLLAIVACYPRAHQVPAHLVRELIEIRDDETVPAHLRRDASDLLDRWERDS